MTGEKEHGKVQAEMAAAARSKKKRGSKPGFRTIVLHEFEGLGLDVQQNYMVAVNSWQKTRKAHQANNN